MLKKLFLFILLFGFVLVYCQSCPQLINPKDGDINVAVDATIAWQDVTGVTGYIISIGTTDGGTDIINQRNVGSATSFMPPLGLPENTQIFVTISLFLLSQPNKVCPSESFRTEDVTMPPDCTVISNIIDGEVGVSVFTNILWNYVSRATDYDILIGTAPGLGDIANTNVTALSFNPLGELPASTLIYVQVIPANENGVPNCPEISFTTGALATLPECTRLISPANGAINVPLTPLLEWEDVPGATGYRVTIGTSPTETNILNNTSFFTNSTFVIDFEPNQTFFITIVPFNSAGDAISCLQESFSTLLGCGPYFDPVSGDLITLHPNLTFGSVFSFCENAGTLELTAPLGAEGYRWYSINNLGTEILETVNNTFTISQNGMYRLEAYNTVSQAGSTIECPTFFDFEVVSSEIAIINNLRTIDTALGLQIIVEASGNGDYEYAIDDINGPYKDSNTFNIVTSETHTLYVRDKNGCGIAEETFMHDLTVEGFPKFFTPNGDLINDFWQFMQPVNGDRAVFNSIYIYDRYGNFLKQITQDSDGWDGSFNGKPLPSGGYWFKAIDKNQREIKGYFTLKR